ncbi:Major facilitator superfamily domain-containing protein 12 [Cichlidogyrus casuarinus]|uniref:Major facilitator superfamily domain-containing protein 12 n=1 Tax=Cichlidogyrus casuarinus TaxID=1844966 RepID=A0ABD2QFC0_9PLAT
MRRSAFAGYVVGHILNDLTASVWFTYTIVFFTLAIRMKPYLTGILIFVGQLSDAVATPVVGFLIDQSLNSPEMEMDSWRYRFTSLWPLARKGYHLGGVVLVTISFPFLFFPIHTDNFCYLAFTFYTLWAIIFQIGWATIQISHLAMINDLTDDAGERTLLTSIRYFFNVLSNLTVFLGFYIAFQRSESEFGAEDASTFWHLCLVLVTIGLVCAIIFHALVRDSDFKRDFSDVPSETTSLLGESRREPAVTNEYSAYAFIGPVDDWKAWLRVPDFWLMAGLYMMTRLIVNISQSYISSYLVDWLHMTKINIALVPLTIYLSSIIASLMQRPISHKVSREVNCAIGVVFTAVFCVLARFAGCPAMKSMVYSAAAMLGIGCTTLLVTNLSMISDLIGPYKHTSAFVFGAMSFCDKISNGITIQIVQVLDMKGGQLYQGVEVYGVATFCIGFILFLLIRFGLTHLRKRTHQTHLLTEFDPDTPSESLAV